MTDGGLKWLARFDGRVAVVTGASGGIGKAIVDRLVRGGATVVAEDIDESIDEMRSDVVVPVRGDVRLEATAEQAINLAIERWGRIDVLINNAGHIVPKTILEITLEEWDAVMDTNAKGMFLHCRVTIPHMLRQGSGAIVTTASISGMVGLASQSAYCASKGAVIQLTRQLAVEYAAAGIRVNAVGPGAVDTPFLTKYLASQPDPEATARAVRSSHPQGRWATAGEVADAVIFLASDAASFINGAVLMVDGGYTAA